MEQENVFVKYIVIRLIKKYIGLYIIIYGIALSILNIHIGNYTIGCIVLVIINGILIFVSRKEKHIINNLLLLGIEFIVGLILSKLISFIVVISIMMSA
ncbi:hypothetical protein SAMN02745168_2495 [Papillibacter cinnamivorans DSM 12816]|uniref:Uncharacterized protein n=1 Tax=Papillibacter cinnamivorans DSM 12816 TaxID=1122930 RepID=A0A1W2C0J1_9FIRM|nr:hypothetical protein SAMN02745168_2495 [Papillibacter cinnamivorans DSM 12816]